MERPVIRAGIAPAEDPSLFTAHCYRNPKTVMTLASTISRISSGSSAKSIDASVKKVSGYWTSSWPAATVRALAEQAEQLVRQRVS